jgi:hypothetical protein
MVFVPGEVKTVAIASGAVVTVSGNVVATSVSGNVVRALISGDVVQVSGQAVTVSGNAVTVSGNAVTVSGNVVQISGQTVTTSMASGSVVTVSGNSIPVERDAYFNYRQNPDWTERWEWLTGSGLTTTGTDLDWFRKEYLGRTHAWWANEANAAPDTWNTPWRLGSGTDPFQPSYFTNGILLTNSKDGSTITEFYLASRTILRPPITMIWDTYLPTLTSGHYPAGTFLSVGLEPNAGGYKGDLYQFSIVTNSGVAPSPSFSLQGRQDTSGASVTVSQTITSGTFGVWSNIKMVVGRNRSTLWQIVSGGSWLNIADLDVGLDELAYVQPFFCLETLWTSTASWQYTPALCSGAIMGEILAYQMEHPIPTEIKTGAIRLLPNSSGGAVLYSGAVDAATVLALPGNAADLYVGGTRNYPYSGFGYKLSPGMPLSMDIKNLNKIYIFACVSGDAVTFMGVA